MTGGRTTAGRQRQQKGATQTRQYVCLTTFMTFSGKEAGEVRVPALVLAGSLRAHEGLSELELLLHIAHQRPALQAAEAPHEQLRPHLAGPCHRACSIILCMSVWGGAATVIFKPSMAVSELMKTCVRPGLYKEDFPCYVQKSGPQQG